MLMGDSFYVKNLQAPDFVQPRISRALLTAFSQGRIRNNHMILDDKLPCHLQGV